MDIIEQLIKSLQEAKAELEKNMNCAPGSEQNMDKAEGKKKKMPAMPPKIESEDHPPKLSEAGAMKLVKEDEPHKDDPKHEEKEQKIASKIKAEASDLMDMHKEELMCSANGQWSLKKDAANPKLAPKEVKIKELQTKIDSGKYKVPASKIADKMVKEEAE